jgi:hypothetical protein
MSIKLLCEKCNRNFPILYKSWDASINDFRNLCEDCIINNKMSGVHYPKLKTKLLNSCLNTLDPTTTISSLIQHELYEANEKFPQFQSRHEAFAVILEEFEEASNEIEDIETGIIEDYWDFCKGSKNHEPGCDEIINFLDCLDAGIMCAIKELIQIGAMVKKARILEE